MQELLYSQPIHRDAGKWVCFVIFTFSARSFVVNTGVRAGGGHLPRRSLVYVIFACGQSYRPLFIGAVSYFGGKLWGKCN